jgi:5-deoxy-glucuronate isomerase
MSPYQSPLLIHPIYDKADYIRVTPEIAHWEHLHFAARKLHQGQKWTHDTANNEYALVVLGGRCNLQSSRGNFQAIGRRPDVFSGMPYAVYLPRQTQFSVEPVSPKLDIAYGWCACPEDHPIRLVKPEDVEIEIRGGGNATRQINKMLPPGFDCYRLVVVEVFTPSGNWSSYPPHKHDVRKVDEKGNLLEADLEEIYFYKIDKPEGYAYQRIYTADGRLDELVLARNDHLVLSPEGYHPVVAAHGYNCYYLNMLAGTDQSLAASDDPAYAWVKSTWAEKDARLPLVTPAMEE